MIIMLPHLQNKNAITREKLDKISIMLLEIITILIFEINFENN